MAHIAGIWWIITGALLVAELVTGTFYLLMVALGFAAGAIALHFGIGNGWQFVIAAAVAGFALLALHLKRRRGGGSLLNRNTRGGARFDRDVNMDIGQQIYVAAWQDSRARADYRGAQWDVQLAPGQTAAPGWYQIIEVRGIQLVVIASTPSIAGDTNA